MPVASDAIPDHYPNAAMLDWFIQLLDIPDVIPFSRHRRLRKRLRDHLARLRPNPTGRDPRIIAHLYGAYYLQNPRGLFGLLDDTFALAEIHPRLATHLLGTDGLPEQLDESKLPWQLREQLRFAIKRYQPVPWAAELEPIPDHYLHLSTEKPGLVAFTADAEKGAADMQTAMKPGRYVTRFYPHLPAHQVRDIQSAVHRATELIFAVTPDEIERVYTQGPDSCMARGADEYDSTCHPVRVYGNSDLQLAYITDTDGDPTARALVWPEKKIHGRMYGDEALLAHLLKMASYERGEFAGARIRRINHGSHTVVMPYIDDVMSFSIVDDTWLAIGGDHDAEATNGLADIRELTRCGYCDDRVSYDDAVYVGGEDWCRNCRHEHAFRSDYSGGLFPNSELETVVTERRTDQVIHEDWATCERDDHATYCDGSGEWHCTANFQFVTLKNGQTWEKSYFQEYGDPADLAPEPTNETDNTGTAIEERAAA